MSNEIVNTIRWFCPICERTELRHPLIGTSEMPLIHENVKNAENTCAGSFIPQVFSPHSGEWVLDVHSNLN